MKRIVLAGAPDHFAGRVQQALRGDAADRLYRWVEQLDGPTAVDALLTLDPAVVILGPGLPSRLALWLAAEFDRTRSSVSVIMALPQDEQLVEEALAAGVRAVVRPEAEPDQILAAVTRALEAVERRQAAAGPAAGPRAGSARVITVVAPKGGAGKTMIATNLAVGLSTIEPRTTTIVDLDLQFGDVAFALGLKPRHTVHDAVSTPQPLDLTTLKVFLAHHATELYALCAPDDPARGEMVEAGSVDEVISLLVSGFEFVVVDTAGGLGEHTLAAIEASTDLVLVADMDVPSIRHLGKVIHVLDRLGMGDARRHIVLNRADARAGLSLGDVAESAGVKVDVEIPASKHVPVALNTGSPLLLSNPKSPASKALWKLIERFTDTAHRSHQNRRTMRWSA